MPTQGMPNKQPPARRGGFQNHGASSQGRVLNGRAPSNTETHTPNVQLESRTLGGNHIHAPDPGDPLLEVGEQHQQPSSQVASQQRGSTTSPTMQEVPLMTQGVIPPEQQSTIEDPPSGEELPSAFWGPPDTPEIEDDPVDMDTDMEDPGTRGGRGINKAPKSQKKRELRVNITLEAGGEFSSDEAYKVIAHRMKYYFNPKHTSWGKVPRSHREFLWKEFRMACRWEPELNERIAWQWNHENSDMYRGMMSKARQKAKEGKRPSWMEVRHYWKLKKYWASPEFISCSEQNRKNRGVELDDSGDVVSKAGPTFMGGQKSIRKRGDNLVAICETKQRKQALVEGSSTVDCIEGEVLSETSNSSKVQWISEKSRMDVENYRKYMDDMFVDKPEERPSESDPRNPIVWAQAVGGPNRGRIRGVSGKADPQLLGYPTTKRQARHVPSVDGNLFQISESQRKAMEEQFQRERREDREKISEELENIRNERQQMTEERENLKSEREHLRSERDRLKAEKEQFMTDITHKMQLHVQQQVQMAISAQQEQQLVSVQQQQYGLRHVNEHKERFKRNLDDDTSGVGLNLVQSKDSTPGADIVGGGKKYVTLKNLTEALNKQKKSKDTKGKDKSNK